MKTSTKFAVFGWFIVIAVALTTCGDSDSEKRAKAERFAALPLDQKIKSISSNITDVNEAVKDEVLVITFFKASIADGKNWTWNFLDTAYHVLSRMEEISPGVPYKRVVFMAQVPTRNNLGQSGSQLGMKVTYELGSLAGAQWKNMTTFDVAELPSEITFRPLGVEAAVEYCNDGDHLKYTPKFCNRAISSKIRNLTR